MSSHDRVDGASVPRDTSNPVPSHYPPVSAAGLPPNTSYGPHNPPGHNSQAAQSWAAYNQQPSYNPPAPFGQQPYHNPWAQHSQQPAYHNQWAQYNQQWAAYYQQLARTGGPPPTPGPQPGLFNPGFYGVQNMFAPTPQIPPMQYDEPSTSGKKKEKKKKAKVEPVNRKASPFAPVAYRGQFDQTQNGSMPAGGFQQLNDGTVVAEPLPERKKGKDPKIMLPAPKPTTAYLLQVIGKPEVVDPPDLKLVILDLNGTLLHRPNARKQPWKMIGRPMLPEFLQYLFDNFAVMIWSSAKPENVKILVETGLGAYNSQLIATWARNTLGLAPQHYSMNVQCYKDLARVWASDEVQCNMIGYEEGKRFDQRNTILIDDSKLKAAAQPFNLLEIPEFTGATDEHNVEDVLGQVAGYLELLKMQEDVSKFINKTPFKADGTWSFDWKHLMPIVEEDKAKEQVPTEAHLEPILVGA
ncbi:HAD-like protein [Lentithecium fluviatile CBS 122367]|uniref:Mitochondrial import inner membrane translocase subunit TIM50 n=1 Tax=Lentithecium fluviatile CBS 122367 TaxID=1168545 RepID=A0A6G1IDE2_9PLEO|nr:HAD-like protein [Lentithecium fluviatile CBS 122367]